MGFFNFFKNKVHIKKHAKQNVSNKSVFPNVENIGLISIQLNKDDPYYLYKKELNIFTYLIGIIHKFNQLSVSGEKINLEYFEKISFLLSKSKDELIRIKEELRLPGGLDFLENNHFDGFEIRDGIFYGCRDNVLTITNPWIKHFNPDNCYLYEVAHYIQYLAFSDTLYCGDTYMEKKTNRSFKKSKTGGKKKWKKNLHLKSYV